MNDKLNRIIKELKTKPFIIISAEDEIEWIEIDSLTSYIQQKWYYYGWRCPFPEFFPKFETAFPVIRVEGLR